MSRLQELVAERLATPRQSALRFGPPLAETVAALLSKSSATRPSVDLIILPESSDSVDRSKLLSRFMQSAPPSVLLRTAGAVCPPHGINFVGDITLRPDDDRGEIGRFLAPRLRRYAIQHIFHLPRSENDISAALIARALTGAPLTIWIGEPVSAGSRLGSLGALASLMQSADVIFCGSTSIRDDVERRFRRPSWVLEPCFDLANLREKPSRAARKGVPGVLVGTLDATAEVEAFLQAWSQTGAELLWLNPSLSAVASHRTSLARAGIVLAYNVPQWQVARLITEAPYAVVVPLANAGTEQDALDARITIPAAVIDVASATGTPLLVAAEGATAAADHVNRFGLGESVEINGRAISAAIERLSSPSAQERIRASAHDLYAELKVCKSYMAVTRAGEGGWIDDPAQQRLYPRSRLRPQAAARAESVQSASYPAASK